MVLVITSATEKTPVQYHHDTLVSLAGRAGITSRVKGIAIGILRIDTGQKPALCSRLINFCSLYLSCKGGNFRVGFHGRGNGRTKRFRQQRSSDILKLRKTDLSRYEVCQANEFNPGSRMSRLLFQSGRQRCLAACTYSGHIGNARCSGAGSLFDIGKQLCKLSFKVSSHIYLQTAGQQRKIGIYRRDIGIAIAYPIALSTRLFNYFTTTPIQITGQVKQWLTYGKRNISTWMRVRGDSLAGCFVDYHGRLRVFITGTGTNRHGRQQEGVSLSGLSFCLFRTSQSCETFTIETSTGADRLQKICVTHLAGRLFSKYLIFCHTFYKLPINIC